MKIALIIERFNPDAGGAEKSTAQIASQLASRGHQVTLLAWASPDSVKAQPAPDTPGAPEDFSISDEFGSVSKHMVGQASRLPSVGTADPPTQAGVLRQNLGIVVKSCRHGGRGGRGGHGGRIHAWQLWRFNRWVQKRLLEDGYDVSLSMTTSVPATVLQPRSGTLRETFARNVAMRDTKVGRWTKWALLRLSLKSNLQLWLERKNLRDPQVKQIAAVSDYVKDQLIEHYHVPTSKIQVIANASVVPGVDAAQRHAWRQTIRQKLGLAMDLPVFLFAATNPKLKGVQTLLRATKSLNAQGLDFAVLIAGNLSYALQNQAARMGMRNKIKFLGKTSQMPALFCAADVTVHPTYYDPSSKVVIESLMLGTVAISTSYNGASDWLKASDEQAAPADRPNLVLDDPSDDVALAQMMKNLMDEQARAKCQPNTDQLVNQLSMQRHVDQLEKLLLDAC